MMAHCVAFVSVAEGFCSPASRVSAPVPFRLGESEQNRRALGKRSSTRREMRMDVMINS
jgi:hypothetical protein